MDAIEYLKIKNRMTQNCNINCFDCPLSYKNTKTSESCTEFIRTYPEKAIEIVENWAKEHPVKTFLTDFLEKYPKALMDSDNTPLNICTYSLGYIELKDCIHDCTKCWNTELITEEVE